MVTALTLSDGCTHHVEAFRTKGETRRDCYPRRVFFCMPYCRTTQHESGFFLIVAGQATVLGFASARALTRATAISPHEPVSPLTAKQSCVLFSTTVSIRLIASSGSSSSSSSGRGERVLYLAQVLNLPLGGFPPFGLLFVELGERGLLHVFHITHGNYSMY
jgi:hypothetical protein